MSRRRILKTHASRNALDDRFFLFGTHQHTLLILRIEAGPLRYISSTIPLGYIGEEQTNLLDTI